MTLHRILAPDGKEWVAVSRRDAAVAATVIAWMGTNVGRSFIMECEREWKACHDKHINPAAARREYQMWKRNKLFEQTPLDRCKRKLHEIREQVRNVVNRIEKSLR